MRILLIGDSQAGNPGAAAKRELESLGHTVTQVHHDGKGPRSYVSDAALWTEYTTLARQHDLVVLFFGHNDLASARLEAALSRMKNGVRPPVWMTGPPQYPNAADQAQGAAIRAIGQNIFAGRYVDAWPFTSTTLPRDPAGFHLTREAATPWGVGVAHAVTRSSGGGGAGWGVAGLAMALFGWWLSRR